MYLKEAFRYQNFLNRMTNQVSMHLRNRGYITKTTQEHFRKKANAEAEDEVVEVKIERPFACTNNQLVDFLLHLMEEKEQLTTAIGAAKRTCQFDIDAELANNRIRQSVAGTLNDMAAIRPSESIIRGTAYKFNGEGNQVPYNYDVKQVTIIDFDRNKVRDNSRALSAKSDEVSAAIDRVMVELNVEYEPEFRIGDSFEDVIEQYISACK